MMDLHTVERSASFVYRIHKINTRRGGTPPNARHQQQQQQQANGKQTQTPSPPPPPQQPTRNGRTSSKTAAEAEADAQPSDQPKQEETLDRPVEEDTADDLGEHGAESTESTERQLMEVGNGGGGGGWMGGGSFGGEKYYRRDDPDFRRHLKLEKQLIQVRENVSDLVVAGGWMGCLFLSLSLSLCVCVCMCVCVCVCVAYSHTHRVWYSVSRRWMHPIGPLSTSLNSPRSATHTQTIGWLRLMSSVCLSVEPTGVRGPWCGRHPGLQRALPAHAQTPRPLRTCRLRKGRSSDGIVTHTPTHTQPQPQQRPMSPCLPPSLPLSLCVCGVCSVEWMSTQATATPPSPMRSAVGRCITGMSSRAWTGTQWCATSTHSASGATYSAHSRHTNGERPP